MVRSPLPRPMRSCRARVSHPQQGKRARGERDNTHRRGCTTSVERGGTTRAQEGGRVGVCDIKFATSREDYVVGEKRSLFSSVRWFFNEPFRPGSPSEISLGEILPTQPCRNPGCTSRSARWPSGGGPRVLGRAVRLKARVNDEDTTPGHLPWPRRFVAAEVGTEKYAIFRNDYPERWITWLVGR